MLAQTVSKNCIKKPLSTRFRIGVLGGLVLAACSLNVWAEPATNRYLQSRLIQADETGNVVIQTRKGDSLRVIAQQYSRVNNIPFARALEILQTTNASQFPNNDADQMLIGTRLVLPAKNQNSQPIATVVPSPESVTETTSGNNVSPSLTTETSSNTPPSTTLPSDSAQTLEHKNDNTAVATTLEQKSHSLRVQLNRLEDKVQSQVEGTAVAPYYAKLKSWFLAIPASLWVIIIPTILLVWAVARLTRRPAEPTNSFESKHDTVQPTASAVEATSEHIAEPNATTEIQTARVPDHVIEGWMESEQAERAGDELKIVSDSTSQDMDVPAAHDNQATPEAAVKPQYSVEKSSQSLSENTQTETGTNQDLNKLKQVLNGLTADQLDLRTQKPAHRATRLNETDTGKMADVNGLLQQYAERVAVKPTEHNIHYGVFKERSRLQKWMHALTPEQLLTHAQSAQQQGQGDVAQYILNEVLLRGDAAQCVQALDLRNVWLTQTRRPSDNEAR